MTDDTDESSDEPLTFAEIMDTATEQIEDELADYDCEIPQHGGSLLVQRVADLSETLTRLDVYDARDDVDISDEDRTEALEGDIVNILLALGVVKYEHDLDIEGAFRDQMVMIAAINSNDSMEEVMREVMGDEAYEEAVAEQNTHPQPGDDVSRDDYDGEPRSFS